ncbi:MAG: DUF1638 domain-containing protein [Desulfarculus sp.]|nr:DUF1638 domain-containing protein [Desulfarculus sp.]
MQLPDGVAVLACQVFAPELESLGVPRQRITFLEQGLHRYPKDLRAEVGQALEKIEADPAIHTVVLLYGYCGGGLEGLGGRRATLVVPRVHDCIPVLLDQDLAPSLVGTAGSFYLSAGWIDHGQTPLTEYYRTCERYDAETSLWVTKEILKGYKDVALIVQEGLIQPGHREYARKMAEMFDLGYREIPGGLDWLKRLLAAHGGEGVLVAPPGRVLTMTDYLGAGSSGSAPAPVAA